MDEKARGQVPQLDAVVRVGGEGAGAVVAEGLSLVALRGAVRLERMSTRLDAAVYAWDGLAGRPGSRATVRGNLAVENLNRARMPRHFACTFDPHLKNHGGDNLDGHIGRKLVSFRVLGDAAPQPAPRPAAAPRGEV